MSLFDRLLSQLKQRGLEVAPAPGKPGMLILRGPEREKTPEIMKAVKAFKALFLAKFGEQPAAEVAVKPEAKAERQSCPQCGRDVRDPEDRERLSGINPFCREVGCPYRKRQ